MTTEQWRRAQELFFAARKLPTDQRQGYILLQTAGDAELASLVLSTLAGDLPLSQVGPYEIVRRIAEGGMAVVWLGYRESWPRPTAIKVPRNALIAPDRQARFLMEQHFLSQLRHPAIAQIYEAGTLPDSTPWFAMEYVEGKPITVHCESFGLSLRRRIEVFLSVVDAVAYAHNERVIHRDIKPSNVFVTDAGEAKLLDFGIAKQIEEAVPDTRFTQTGLQPMTLPYAAPELIFSGQVGRQTDVYALGILLYELLTGVLPFKPTGVTASNLRDALSAPVKRPSRAARDLGFLGNEGMTSDAWLDLDVLTLTAMHQDITKRYASASELRDDVQRFLRREPLQARSDSLTYRLRKFVERHQVPVFTTVAVLLIFAIAAAYAAIAMTKSRNAALAQAERATRIQQFMVDLFVAGDLENGPSKEMKVGDLLAIAVKNVHDLDKDALAQGDLYDTLGTIYQEFGDFSQAESLLQTALSKRRQIRGDPSPEVAETILNLGLLRSAQADYLNAIKMAKDGLDMARRTLPSADPKVGFYETALGSVYVDKGDYPEALRILEIARRLQEGRTDCLRGYGACLNLLATVNTSLNNLSEAEEFTRRSIAAGEQLTGPDHGSLLHDYANLGMIQVKRRRFANAEASYRRALYISEQWFSPGHPETADLKRLLAQALLNEDKIDEASDLIKNALPDLEAAYGSIHPRVANALQVLGRIEMARGHSDAGLADLGRAVTILREKPQGDALATALSNLGKAYLTVGRPQEAEAVFSESTHSFLDPPSNGPLALASAQAGWGKALVRQGRFSEAEGHLLTAYQAFNKPPIESPEQRSSVKDELVKVYKAQGRLEKVSEYKNSN